MPAEELIAQAARDDGLPTGQLIPGPMAEYLTIYWMAGDDLRKAMLERQEWLNEWAAYRARTDDQRG